MSCHYHVFLGPYLEVHNPIRDTTTKRQSCPNEKCSNHKKEVLSQFCPKCGEKIRHLDVPSRGRKEFNVYDEFNKERLTELLFEGMPKECKDYMYFHSNMNDCAGRTFYDSTEFVPMDEKTPTLEMDAFASYFSNEILHIEKKFGKENVKVKWGAVAYWS